MTLLPAPTSMTDGTVALKRLHAVPKSRRDPLGARCAGVGSARSSDRRDRAAGRGPLAVNPLVWVTTNIPMARFFRRVEDART